MTKEELKEEIENYKIEIEALEDELSTAQQNLEELGEDEDREEAQVWVDQYQQELEEAQVNLEELEGDLQYGIYED